MQREVRVRRDLIFQPPALRLVLFHDAGAFAVRLLLTATFDGNPAFLTFAHVVERKDIEYLLVATSAIQLGEVTLWPDGDLMFMNWPVDDGLLGWMYRADVCTEIRAFLQEVDAPPRPRRIAKPAKIDPRKAAADEAWARIRQRAVTGVRAWGNDERKA
ncbi:MAG: hypothetical protein ACO1SV_27730 [Fimbriimonas sp.]